MQRDSIISVTTTLVRILRILNIVFGVLAVVFVIISFPAADAILARLNAKYHGTVDAIALLWLLRGIEVLGLIGGAVIERVPTPLGAVLTSLRAGDAFAPENAARLTTIAWALLAWQVLKLLLGAADAVVAWLGANTMTWTPSIGGWLSVLVAFVLARVFVIGSRMRAELSTVV